uniref:Uncharacterized protein n=1 Tax=Escherichia coli TaxID=562 RepID=A0A2S1JAR6_ECOLX|nr:hypothetical protein MCJBJECH_00079 [Escherichia coli]
MDTIREFRTQNVCVVLYAFRESYGCNYPAKCQLTCGTSAFRSLAMAQNHSEPVNDLGPSYVTPVRTVLPDALLHVPDWPPYFYD